MSEPSLAIALESLSKKFGPRTVVDAVDLQVNAGEIFALLGPNGAGKSTIIKMLTTLLPSSSGSGKVAGFDLHAQPSEVRGRIGYVPQMLSADGALTGRENLELSGRLYLIEKAIRQVRIQEALAFMGLEEAADRLVKTYSGGMIRRLELAQAILHRPSVLFLDEPTIGLDPMAKRSVWALLKNMREKFSMTIFMTTHDMEEADSLCGRLAILHQGKIAAIGNPGELKKSVSTGANLEDVFAYYSGGAIEEGGTYRDVRQTRSTANRLR